MYLVKLLIIVKLTSQFLYPRERNYIINSLYAKVITRSTHVYIGLHCRYEPDSVTLGTLGIMLFVRPTRGHGQRHRVNASPIYTQTHTPTHKRKHLHTNANTYTQTRGEIVSSTLPVLLPLPKPVSINGVCTFLFLCRWLIASYEGTLAYQVYWNIEKRIAPAA